MSYALVLVNPVGFQNFRLPKAREWDLEILASAELLKTLLRGLASTAQRNPHGLNLVLGADRKLVGSAPTISFCLKI